jgi:hypothetical protein
VRCAAKIAERQLSHSYISVAGQLQIAVGGNFRLSLENIKMPPVKLDDMRSIILSEKFDPNISQLLAQPPFLNLSTAS